MDIESLLKGKVDTRVFIDTCTLLHPKIELLLAKIVPILAVYNLKLIIPASCIGELKKLGADPKLKIRVVTAFYALEKIKSIVEYRGSEDDGAHADNVFLRVFTQFRTKYHLVLITEDKKLRKDILELNRLKSVRGHNVYVFSANDILELPELQNKKKSNPKETPKSKFHFCTQITASKEELLTISEVPNVGDVVYDRIKTPIRLTEEISSGGEGCVYKTNKGENLVAKIYFANKLTNHKKQKIDDIVASGLSIKGVCFPQTQLYNKNGVFVGYLMPKADGRKLEGAVFKGEQRMKRCFASWTRMDLVNLAITIFTTIKKIHDSGILIGDINGANILVKSPTEVFFVDTDSFQINNYPCPVGMSDFTAPEIQGKDYKGFLRTIGNENFAIATLLFKIMMFGLSPYAQQDGSDVVHNIRTGNFSFPYKENSNGKIPKGDWCFYWSHLFFKLKEHFYKTFRKGEMMFEEKCRPGVEVWLKDLYFYRKQLQDGTLEGIDKNSLELFPKTYKKAIGVEYLTCKICHQEKRRSFMYQDDICWDCHWKEQEEERQKEKREREEARRKQQELRRKQEVEKQLYRNSVYRYITCSACHKQFAITNGEHDYYESKGLDLPKRCKECRESGRRPTHERSNDYVNDSGGCFITTAVCEYFGKEDDCYELTMLRSFRDNWLAKQKNGNTEIALYYQCAPQLVEKMKVSPDYASTCEELMRTYIHPCVELIKKHQNEACRQLYVQGLQYMLNKYHK